MALTRRQFLKNTATLAAGAAAAPAMKWLPGTGVAYASGPSDAIVVFLELYGGNDGLNMVYPLDGNQRLKYEEYRPTMRAPKVGDSLSDWTTAGFDTSDGVLAIGADSNLDHYALNPAMKSLHDVYNDGNLAIVPGVHYPFTDYSHFRSEVIYYTGDPVGTAGLGWMGKYFNLMNFQPTDVPAVMIGDDYNPLFTPTNTSLFAFNSLSELRFPAGSHSSQRSATFTSMYGDSALSDPNAFPELVNIGNTGVAAVDTFHEYYQPGSATGKVEKLLIDSDGNYASYNDLVWASPLNPSTGQFAQNYLTDDLRHVAAVIRSNVGARFFHVAMGGFDTHSNQEQDLYHSNLLFNVSEAIAAFWREMQSTVTLPAGYAGDGYLTGDLSSKVLILTLSEFGRTNKQNSSDKSSAGTDHGRSAPQFVVGSSVIGGIHGQYPSLQDPDLDDDLRMSHDIRDYFGTVLDKWLNVAVSDIGPGPGKLFSTTPAPGDDLGETYLSYTPVGFLP
ncbi:MAG TPA: DUF1501 domain-containing protein [Candidatus Binatia bacterium]|jgi:uncharacterized protein (DUF1501 family)